MELIEIAKFCVKIGAILGFVLGLIAMIFGIYVTILQLSFPIPSYNFIDLFLIVLNVFAILASYLIYTRYLPMIQDDPYGIAIIFLVLGILIALGAWGIGGILIFLGGLLVLIDEYR